MARVIVYERPVDAVLTDVAFYDKLNRAKNGITIKQEPVDPDIDKPGDSLVTNNTDIAVQCKSTLLEDQLSNSLYNKENEHVSSTNHTNLTNEKSSADCKKHKQGENSQSTKKYKSYAYRSLDAADYRRRKKRRKVKGIECDVCYVTFSRESTMKQHKKFYNTCVKTHCDTCNAVFNTPLAFQRHRDMCIQSQGQKILNKRYKLICYFCGQNFPSKEPLQAHLFHIHGNLIWSPAASIIKEEEIETIESASNLTNMNTTEDIKNSPKRTSAKKMRQTTLTEFLSRKYLTKKNDEFVDSQEAVQNGDETLANRLSLHDPPGGSEAIENSLSITPTKKSILDQNQSSTNEKPFVQIYVSPDTIMSLLSKRIKTEFEDSHEAPTALCNTTYNLRRVRNDPKRLSLELGNVFQKSYRKRKRRAKPRVRLSDWQIRAKFNCKECVVRLERCDTTSRIEKSRADESQNIEIEKRSEDDRNTSAGSNLSLMDLDVSLLRMEDAAKDTIDGSPTSSNELDAKKRKEFQCRVCRKCFSSRENMREHLELFHVAYMSSICNARYTSMHKLLNHYLRQHAVFKRKVCCVCHEKLGAQVMLKQHMILHCIKIIRSKKDNLPIDSEVRCNVAKKQHRCKCRRQFWLESCLKQHQRFCRSVNTGTKNTVSSSSEGQADASNVKRNLAPLMKHPETNCSKHRSDKKKKNKNSASSKPFAGGTSQLLSLRRLKRLVIRPACVKGYQISVTDTKLKFPCSICNKQFRTFQNLCMHERTFCKHANNICSICTTAFSTKRLLHLHMLATHTPGCTKNYKYFCKFCNQGFIKHSNVEIHERHFHANQIPVSHKPVLNSDSIWNINTVCTVCNLMFESYEHFIEHNMYYYKAQAFTCTFCGNTFQGMYMLHHHNKLVHYPVVTRNAYTYMCDICNEGFNHESHFHAHKLHVHLHETASVQDSLKILQFQASQDHNYALNNSYSCHVCDMHFTNEKDLSMHKLEYAIDGNFQCDKCDRKCRTEILLTKHLTLTHSGKNISNVCKCHLCGEILMTSRALACHEKHFHPGSANVSEKSQANQAAHRENVGAGNTRVNTFTCLTCGMRFESKRCLKEHMTEFSDKGAFACEICHRKFWKLCRLEAHKVKHSRLNYILSEYHCPICQEGFGNAADVRIHILHLHKYETFPNSTTMNRKKRSSSGTGTGPRVSCGTRKDKSMQANKSSEASTSDGASEAATSLPTTSEKSSAPAPLDSSEPAPLDSSEPAPLDSSEPAPLDSSEPAPLDSSEPAPLDSSEPAPLDSSEPAPLDSSEQPNASTLPSVEVNDMKCPECRLVFDNIATLRNHRSWFANSGDYACMHCARKFPTQAILDAHLVKHSVNAKIGFLKYKCFCCEEKFRNLISEYSHVVHVHGKDKLNDQSILSWQPTVGKDGIEYVKYRGMDIPIGKIFVDEDLESSRNCDSDVEAVSSTNLSEENKVPPPPVAAPNVNRPEKSCKTLDEKSTWYICSMCNTKYFTLQKFQMHFSVTHRNIIHRLIARPVKVVEPPAWSCSMCNIDFFSKQGYVSHVENTHVPRPFVDSTLSEKVEPATKKDDSNAVEIIWEKMPVDVDATKDSKVADADIEVIEGGTNSVTAPQTLLLTNTAAPADDVGKVKVKSFAKMTY